MSAVTQQALMSLGGNGNDAFTKLLAHMDGTDASTTFTDSSSIARTITAVGNAQIDTAQSKFGGASGLFDGTGDYLTTADSADFFFDTGNFTIDFWIRWSSVTDAGLISQKFGADANNLVRLIHDTSELVFQAISGGSARAQYRASPSFSADTWYHIAIVRSGTAFFMFKDGTAMSLTTDTAISTNSLPDIAAALEIGRSLFNAADQYVNGWFEEVHLQGSCPVDVQFHAADGTLFVNHRAEAQGSMTIYYGRPVFTAALSGQWAHLQLWMPPTSTKFAVVDYLQVRGSGSWTLAQHSAGTSGPLPGNTFPEFRLLAVAQPPFLPTPYSNAGLHFFNGPEIEIGQQFTSVGLDLVPWPFDVYPGQGLIIRAGQPGGSLSANFLIHEEDAPPPEPGQHKIDPAGLPIIGNCAIRASAVYDGNTAQGRAAGGFWNDGIVAWSGLNLLTPRVITGAKGWSSTDHGWMQANDGLAITVELYASNAAPANNTDGTLLKTLVSGQSDTSSQLSFADLAVSNATAYQYVWLRYSPAPPGATSYNIAEQEFYQTV